MQTWCLGTLFSGGLGRFGFVVGLNDLSLFQPKRFYHSTMIWNMSRNTVMGCMSIVSIDMTKMHWNCVSHPTTHQKTLWFFKGFIFICYTMLIWVWAYYKERKSDESGILSCELYLTARCPSRNSAVILSNWMCRCAYLIIRFTHLIT